MDPFLKYDLIFLVVFTIFVVWFLSRRKKNLSREGIIFMYRTQLGVRAIKWVGDKFRRTLNALKWVIIPVGLLLMILIMWMLGQTLSIYVLHPEITNVIRAPPIAPLIPYFPQLFGMQSFFPPFYFTYFILALAIVAVVHEFSHGIFMRRFGVRIKSTGLVFLGPILGAFVEEERKGFEKKKISEQMTILGAGVFANLIFAAIFYGLYVLFFFTSFTANGYIFDTYAISEIPFSSITQISGEGNLTKLTTTNGNYYLDKNLATQLSNNETLSIFAYQEAPAFLSQMKGAIILADDVEILNHESLRIFLENKNPGDEVTFTTQTNEGREEYTIVLGQHPENSEKAYLGVGHTDSSGGTLRKFLGFFISFKESSTYYLPNWDGEFVYFVYNLLWWIMIINLLVALFNMMPLGILDGGRFFYLAILSITGSDRLAKGAFKFVTYLIIALFFALMFFWLVGIS